MKVHRNRLKKLQPNWLCGEKTVLDQKTQISGNWAKKVFDNSLDPNLRGLGASPYTCLYFVRSKNLVPRSCSQMSENIFGIPALLVEPTLGMVRGSFAQAVEGVTPNTWKSNSTCQNSMESIFKMFPSAPCVPNNSSSPWWGQRFWKPVSSALMSRNIPSLWPLFNFHDVLSRIHEEDSGGFLTY